jgi:glycosyltransferase involved in cell wall biosynthesis
MRTRQDKGASKPKLLLLAPRFPYPALSGGKLFLLHLARALSDHRITLLSICNTREEMSFVPQDGLFHEIHKVHLPRWQSVKNVLSALPTRTPLQLAYYRSEAFQRKVQELLPQHDLVVAHLIRTGQYVSSAADTPRVLLMSDAISLAYRRMASLPGAPRLWHYLYRLELSRLQDYERACPQNFQQTWLHSDIDRRFLDLDESSACIVPVGIDLAEFPFHSSRSGDVAVFIGNMGFSLNLDACNYFIRDVLPALRTKANIRFRIVGACAPALKKMLEKHPGVEVTGTVPRIADFVDGAFCGVCPVRGGAGIQNKVLNYLALGLPTVTSQVGLEGLDATPGRDLLVYRNTEEAVEMILALHRGPETRARLAANGRALIERVHDWELIYSAIRSQIARLAVSNEPKMTERVVNL